MFGGVPVASLLTAHGVVSVGVLYTMNRMLTGMWVREMVKLRQQGRKPENVKKTSEDILVVFDHCDGILKTNLFRHRCLVDWTPFSPSQ